jgi:rod shape-determining protein MreC
MNAASRRLMAFGLATFFCLGLLGFGLLGFFRPLQGALSAPLTALQQLSNGASRRASSLLSTLADLQVLAARNAELERALINFQAEIVELREISADYERLAALSNFRGITEIRRTVAATVIGRDTSGLLRTITLDRGSRDGIVPDMPVITELGLVGRIARVSATSAQVQLLNDVNSYVNARLQTTRSEGSIQGTAAGGLQMIFIPLTSTINDGDTVVTSGIGGAFPRGLLIGQVIGSSLDDSNLFQQAQVASLINFDRLEVVMIITDFEALDSNTFPTATPSR